MALSTLPIDGSGLFVAASVLGTFFATTLLVLALTNPVETPATRLAKYARIQGRRTSPGADTELVGFRERILSPALQRLFEFAARTTPAAAHKAVAADLVMAGAPGNPTVFLGIRTLLTIGLPVLAAVQLIASPSRQPVQWILLALALLWGRKLPTMWLRRRIRSRQREIDRRLPYSLDLMVACLEGGLSLDAALAKVVEQSEGPLAIEVRRTLQEMALGRPTAEAIRDLGDRTGAPGLKRLTEDIVQSERMGISIAESLRGLARDSRIQRRQQAEELARKAPIKMVPVLIFCVLPALGIVTTAPAVILLTRTFAQNH
ncbi:MAG: type II secretion system F family protein [Chloroflexi bacterium]|nr:type II secretion system F family protein [Chloroflexota bacterium]MBV9547101.1 type II secretion system F family protein [Chloroflexota bacterium]